MVGAGRCCKCGGCNEVHPIIGVPSFLYQQLEDAWITLRQKLIDLTIFDYYGYDLEGIPLLSVVRFPVIFGANSIWHVDFHDEYLLDEVFGTQLDHPLDVLYVPGGPIMYQATSFTNPMYSSNPASVVPANYDQWRDAVAATLDTVTFPESGTPDHDKILSFLDAGRTVLVGITQMLHIGSYLNPSGNGRVAQHMPEGVDATERLNTFLASIGSQTRVELFDPSFKGRFTIERAATPTSVHGWQSRWRSHEISDGLEFITSAVHSSEEMVGAQDGFEFTWNSLPSPRNVVSPKPCSPILVAAAINHNGYPSKVIVGDDGTGMPIRLSNPDTSTHMSYQTMGRLLDPQLQFVINNDGGKYVPQNTSAVRMATGGVAYIEGTQVVLEGKIDYQQRQYDSDWCDPNDRVRVLQATDEPLDSGGRIAVVPATSVAYGNLNYWYDYVGLDAYSAHIPEVNYFQNASTRFPGSTAMIGFLQSFLGGECCLQSRYDFTNDNVDERRSYVTRVLPHPDKRRDGVDHFENQWICMLAGAVSNRDYHYSVSVTVPYTHLNRGSSSNLSPIGFFVEGSTDTGLFERFKSDGSGEADETKPVAMDQWHSVSSPNKRADAFKTPVDPEDDSPQPTVRLKYITSFVLNQDVCDSIRVTVDESKQSNIYAPPDYSDDATALYDSLGIKGYYGEQIKPSAVRPWFFDAMIYDSDERVTTRYIAHRVLKPRLNRYTKEDGFISLPGTGRVALIQDGVWFYSKRGREIHRNLSISRQTTEPSEYVSQNGIYYPEHTYTAFDDDLKLLRFDSFRSDDDQELQLGSGAPDMILAYEFLFEDLEWDVTYRYVSPWGDSIYGGSFPTGGLGFAANSTRFNTWLDIVSKRRPVDLQEHYSDWPLV